MTKKRKPRSEYYGSFDIDIKTEIWYRDIDNRVKQIFTKDTHQFLLNWVGSMNTYAFEKAVIRAFLDKIYP
jgi:hypothetical protein